MSDKSGFRAVIDNLIKTQPAPMSGHSFVGYRRKAFSEFVAVFKSDVSEFINDQYTCEQRVKNATPGTEAHEAAAFALKHWPSA